MSEQFAGELSGSPGAAGQGGQSMTRGEIETFDKGGAERTRQSERLESTTAIRLFDLTLEETASDLPTHLAGGGVSKPLTEVGGQGVKIEVEAVAGKDGQTDLSAIANLIAGLGVDGHRADLVILKTARAHAAFQGRTNITHQDILLASELALPHRLKRGPFQDREMTSGDLEERLEQAESDASGAEQAVPTDQVPQPGGAKKKL